MYTYKITNNVSAPFWVMDSIESNLRAFCNFNGLSIDIFTSGLIFKDMSFVIRGECKERWQADDEGKKMLAEVKHLLEQYT